MSVEEVVEPEVLVVGAGGAGTRAALEASSEGADVALVTDSLFGKGGLTVTGMGGINVALGNVDPEDDWEVHFEDTVRGSYFLSNQRLVEVLTKEAPDRVLELEDFGFNTNRTDEGLILQRIESGQTYHRVAMSGTRTGHELMKTLMNECLRREVRVMEETFVTNLILNDGKIAGATGLDMKNGSFILFRTPSVILATGGAGQIFEVTSNPFQSTGDGKAMAIRGGAELVDMEQYQFHPTGMVFPDSAKGVLVSEAVRGDGGRLFNTEGERFMEKYDPEYMELATRDVVSRAIYREVEGGRGTEHGGVYLDISHKNDEYIESRLAGIVDQLLRTGVDIRKEPMEVYPTGHFQVGGIKIDENANTTIPGLFAAGEEAGGVHGANRLGANSFPELLVFGVRAARSAVKHAEESGKVEIDFDKVEGEFERVRKPLEREEGVSPSEVRSKIHNIMTNKAGIIRSEESLKEALRELERIRREDLPNMAVGKDKRYNYACVEALKVQNMVETCEAIVRPALMRDESRGVHYREDYPDKDDENWLKNIHVKREGEDWKLNAEPIVITRLNPEE